MAARIAAKLFLLLFITLAARTLGRAGFGSFSYHLAFAQLFAFLLDLGVATASVREGSRDEAKSQRIFGSALFVKLALVLPVVALVPFLSMVYAGEGSWYLGFFAISVVALDSFAAFLWGPFRIRNNLRHIAFAEVGRAVLTLVFFALATWGGWAGAGVALACYFLGALAAFRYPVAQVWAHQYIILSGVQWPAIRALLRPALIISAASALYVAGNRLDILLLEKLKGQEEVGLYNSAYTLFMNIDGIVLLACMVVFPRLSAVTATGISATRSFILRMASPFLALSLPIALVGPILAAPVTRIIFGAEFIFAGPMLAILLLAAGLLFPGKLLWYLMIACDRQARLLGIAVVAVALNLGLNFLLIPSMGGRGSAIATLVMEIILLIGFLVTLQAYIPWRDILRETARPATAAVIVAFICLTALAFIPYVLVPLVGLLYLPLLRLFSGRRLVHAFGFADK